MAELKSVDTKNPFKKIKINKEIRSKEKEIQKKEERIKVEKERKKNEKEVRIILISFFLFLCIVFAFNAVKQRKINQEKALFEQQEAERLEEERKLSEQQEAERLEQARRLAEQQKEEAIQEYLNRNTYNGITYDLCLTSKIVTVKSSVVYYAIFDSETGVCWSISIAKKGKTYPPRIEKGTFTGDIYAKFYTDVSDFRGYYIVEDSVYYEVDENGEKKLNDTRSKYITVPIGDITEAVGYLKQVNPEECE